ncbi:MAG: UDP-N-acetylmuramate dehydrogenase [Candidatus Eisenbacteria bacterium]|uniref:UDP-N-acetylenolpyruvoylglucosamine reductase n=1 Tax=Eiseniibacteriota bacterium TaxID=2212470 RepID=A0A7Y2EEI4_UNCEI|nr:UDP-N-acetylmuramate dehydrogenase [Candidatus Eisenbacteria bacterium]
MSLNYESVLKAAPERTELNAVLAPLLAYRVGGPADVLAQPEHPNELGAILKAAHALGAPVYILGGGTNLIVRDGGIRGVVIHLGRGFRTSRVEQDRLIAGASATMMQAATAAERAGLAGFEFGYDIPGTVGGALTMNAGAHGSEVKDVLVEVRGYNVKGDEVRVPVDAIRFAYRTAVYPEHLYFSQAVFQLAHGDAEAVAAKRKANHAYRMRTQPKGRSVGSVFKNPPGDYAGRLIEACGFKGMRRGGAHVSEKHANWILNDQNATAADIEGLIRDIQSKVKTEFDVMLQTEVKIVGEALQEVES